MNLYGIILTSETLGSKIIRVLLTVEVKEVKNYVKSSWSIFWATYVQHYAG
jgi:hypothetical protein